MSYISGRTERLLPARSVWTTSMVWWHAGFYAALGQRVLSRALRQ